MLTIVNLDLAANIDVDLSNPKFFSAKAALGLGDSTAA